MVTHTTTRTLATLSETGTTRKKATVTTWNNGKPKLDIRIWRQGDDGTETPGKGVTLDRKELEALLKALDAQGIPDEI